MLAMGNALHAPLSGVTMPSTLLPRDAVPIAPLVDSAPLPMLGDPPRYRNEVTLPVPDTYEWPRVHHFALYDHSGHFPQAWSELGKAGISVADRRASKQPPDDWLHVIGDVQDFVNVYPYPIGLQTNSVTCAYMNLASRTTWREKIKDGSMLRSAEEFVWINHIGARSAGEQPPTVLETLVGPPTFSTNATNHFAARDKTWRVWLRGLPIVPDGRVTPDHLRLTRRGAAQPERRMLVRTETELQLARDFAAAWNLERAAEVSRPAAQTHPDYEMNLAALRYNYDIFKASYAPAIAATELEGGGHSARYVIGIPIAWSEGPVALVNVGTNEMFAVPYRSGEKVEAHYHQLTEMLPCDSQPHLLCMTPVAEHYVCALPCSDAPLVVMREAAHAHGADDGAACVAWCTAAALQGTAQLTYVVMAIAQLQSSTRGAPLRSERVGAWTDPRPVVPHRASDTWERKAPLDEASGTWQRFLDDERMRAAEISAALTAAGPDAHPFAPIVMSAASYAAEIPVPEQGLPSYEDPRLLLIPTPQPPMPLCTDYLRDVPPQAVPPGYENAYLPLRSLVKRWPRQELAKTYTLQAAYDLDCKRNGGTSGRKRPTFAAYGDGAFVWLKHADGVGSFLANTIIWERTDRGYRPMDITAAIRDHKKREVLMRIIGATTDRELLYFCLHGVRWLKFDAPRQIRFGRNVESLGPRVARVGHATAKLIKAGLYGVVKLIEAPPPGVEIEPLDPDLDNFLAFVPCYDMGCGGQDKADNPDEARKTGNTSDPQPGKGATTREARAEDRHNVPGVPILSFNDLTGPRKMTPGYDGPPPSFPDPETKSRPRHLATGAAYLSHVAFLADDYLVGIKDDFRWFFWQFYLHQSQLWLSVEHLWVPFEVEVDGVTTYEWWFCGVIPYVMNMGTRPASKIACRFSEVFQAEWRTRMRAEVVPTWLARQSQRVRDALERRRAALGGFEADPFIGWLYTDDFTMFFIGAWLAAMGAALWRRIVNEANIWMSKKVGAGTVIDSHGGRFVLNGGFTCLTPTKRVRGIATATAAITRGITVDELIATNSFFVHVDDIINLLPGTLKGVWAPTKAHAVGTNLVTLDHESWPRPRAAYKSVIQQLQRRAAASFLCAVDDAHQDDSWTGCCVPFATSTSDACSNPARGLPGVVGWLDGQYWHFPLTGAWANRHITVTEALGYAGNVIILGHTVGTMQHLIKGDATGGLAMLMGTTGTDDLRYMRMRLEATREWQDVSHYLWALHLAGAANIFADLGSRNEWETLARVAAAYGIRLREVPLTAAFLAYAADVLHNTTYYEPKPARAITHNPFVPVEKYKYGVEAIEHMGSEPPLTPPMLAISRASPRAAREARPRDGSPTPIMIKLNANQGATAQAPPSPVRMHLCTSPHTPPMVQRRPTPRDNAHTCTSHPSSTRAGAGARLDATWRATQRDAPRGTPKARCHSPQPTTAHDARRAAALTTANTLANDDTAYAICPNDPSRIKKLCVEAAAARHAAIPKGTSGSDSWGFTWVMRFCTEHDTPWMRPRHVEPEWHEREAYLVALALLWLSMHMPPSARRRARGYDEAMPDSSLNAIYGWRRVLKDCGRYLAPMGLALAQCRGIRLQYTIAWGNDSLVPQKHRPIPKALVDAILKVLETYGVPGWSKERHDMWRRLIKYELVTGTRGNEAAGEDTRLTRGDFDPVIGGIVYEPTFENFKRIRAGDYIRGKSAPSKCDRTNAHWGAKDMWFEFDPTSDVNFARDWVDFELTSPCPPPMRRTTPAFSPTGDAKPLTTAMLHVQHKELIAAADPTAEHTFHDWRARLAQALVNAGCTDAVIQAALRWKSPQSIQAYAGLPPSEYARMVEDAATRDAATPSTRTIPIYDPSEACAQMDDAIKALERDLGAPKRPTAKPTAAVAPVPAAPPCPNTPTTQPRSKRSPPPAGETYDLGELGVIQGDTASRRPAVGSTLDLPGYLWPGSSAPSATATCDVVAWASTLDKYIVYAHDDQYHYAMPPGIVNKRMRAQRSAHRK